MSLSLKCLNFLVTSLVCMLFAKKHASQTLAYYSQLIFRQTLVLSQGVASSRTIVISSLIIERECSVSVD